MTQIKDALLEFNPWWKGRFTLEYKERELYQKLQKFLALPQIIALTGLRRVGKTTLMFKIAEDALLHKRYDAKEIIYFSFDEFKDVDMRAILKEYEEIMEKDITHGKYLLLLDEMQKLDNWENQLKSFYDVFKKRVKIIISGSESLFIRRKSRETLAGRLFEFKVELLSFKEFLTFKGISFKPIGLHERELMHAFKEFTLTQGFPELVGIMEKEIIRKYIQESIMERVIYRDMTEIFDIKDISILASLFRLLMENPGQIIELSELSKELKISRQSLSSYFTYLEESFLVRKLYNFSRNRRKVERKLKKYYPAILSVDLLFKEDVLSQSRVFEWLLVNQLHSEFFWRDSYQHEVDMVFFEDKIVPIEVKYGKTDVKSLLVFMGKFKIHKGYIVSFDTEEKRKIDGKDVSIIPAFKLLLDLDSIKR